jgi:hypothetical protein
MDVTGKALNDIGDPAAPVGSPAWCKYAHIGLRERKQRAQSQVSSLKYGLLSFRNDGRWKQLTNRKGSRFTSWEQYVEYPEPWGLGLRLDVAQAVMEEPDDNALLGDVMQRAARAQEIEAKDQANLRPAGRPENVDNKNSVVNNYRPTGNAAAAALRRLRKDRPDIHARVLAGELSPHAGMIEAGFRKKRESKRLTPLERILKLLPKITPTEWRQLRARGDERFKPRGRAA